jgi:hypothetical protein
VNRIGFVLRGNGTPGGFPLPETMAASTTFVDIDVRQLVSSYISQSPVNLVSEASYALAAWHVTLLLTYSGSLCHPGRIFAFEHLECFDIMDLSKLAAKISPIENSLRKQQVLERYMN